MSGYGQPGALSRIRLPNPDGTGSYDMPVDPSSVTQYLSPFGLAPTGNAEKDASTALAAKAFTGDLIGRGYDTGAITNILDYYRRANRTRAERITAGDLTALLEPASAPPEFARSLDVGAPVLEEEEPIPMFASGGTVTSGTNLGAKHGTGGREVNPLSMKPNEYNVNAGPTNEQYENFYFPWRQWADDGYFPDLTRNIREKFGDNLRWAGGRYYGTDRYGQTVSMSPYGGNPSKPILPRDQWGRPIYGQNHPSQGPRAMADGGSLMLDEPTVGMGLMSGEPQFLAGEAGPERMDITPMGGGGMPPTGMPTPPQPAPRTEPEQRLDAMLAGLKVLARGVNRRARPMQIPTGSMG
jgi:hypothetical protein